MRSPHKIHFVLWVTVLTEMTVDAGKLRNVEKRKKEFKQHILENVYKII